MSNLTSTDFSQPHSPVSSSSSRIDWVDYAKGFCIIFVVMMHSTLGVEKLLGETGWMTYLVAFAKPFRMPDFFLISGLFLANVINRDWRLYLDRKVVHFFYFYILWVGIQFGFKAPASFMGGMPLEQIATDLAMTMVQPFGTLWFIYLLPVFFVVTKLLKNLPWYFLLGGAALLQIAPVHTGWVTLDEFASRYVFFVAGYLFAPRLFAAAGWVMDNAKLATLYLFGWVAINGFFVVMQWDGMPLIGLGLGVLGAAAVVFISALLSKLQFMSFLKYLGANSIVVYLAFFLPMVVTRVLLTKLVPDLDIGTMAVIITFAGVTVPVIMFKTVQFIGFGKFLFYRPQWARLDTDRAPRKAALQPAE